MKQPLAARFADWAVDTDIADIPARASEQATLGILDVVGVMMAGATTRLGRTLLRYVEQYGGRGPSSIVEGATASPADAARTNGSLAHVLDFDDRGHASTHLFASALAVGELRRTSGPEVLRAYIIGREIRVALDRIVDEGRLDRHGPGSRGWHSTGVNGPIASAATAGLLLGLDAPRLAIAMAMATSSASGVLRNFGTGTKPQHAGRAAAEGVIAAMLAGEGVDADPAAIDGPSGLFEALGLDREAAAASVRADFGQRWDLVERGVRVKPYPSCTTSHIGIETAAAIHREHGPIALDRIERVRMDAKPFMLMREHPTAPTEARFNMMHGLLIGLDKGSVQPSDYGHDVVARLEAADAYGRIEHVPGATDIEIVLTDGSTIRHGLEPLRNLADQAAIEAKFLANAGGTERAARIQAVVLGFDGIEDVRDLGRSLRGDPDDDAARSGRSGAMRFE
jgi:2-methylcitrate dehydratase PrpD